MSVNAKSFPALQVTSLHKFYGSFEAVKGISFEVAPGEIFALIGPNGAGKSTTLRTVATLLRPTSGTLTVDGHDIQKEPDTVRSLISYLPEEAGAYKNLSGLAYLDFMAGLYANSPAEKTAAIKRAIKICQLGSRIQDKVSTYSKGMSRKLLLARAVMTEPVLAILDEPTGGLDVLNAREIRQTIRDLTKNGTAVLLSSHNMLEVEFLSDRVGIIYQGVLLETGTAASLKKKYQADNLEEVFAKAIQS
ncbi:ABC transporter ATP-binding protein [Patescibacteria group bacterium]|nr:ABC transporter ATP-binding protein [Patescibacteria group bacterium]